MKEDGDYDDDTPKKRNKGMKSIHYHDYEDNITNLTMIIRKENEIL